MKKINVKIGDKYGRLTINKELGKLGKERLFECKCSCGNIKNIQLHSLRAGVTKSCGCFAKEINATKNKTHGETKTKFYGIWRGSRERCNNLNSKDYKNYGGRGIKHLWDKYEDFKKDMYNSYLKHKKENNYTSLDRIDVNGNYCKENCRWANRIMQQNNRRKNNNK